MWWGSLGAVLQTRLCALFEKDGAWIISEADVLSEIVDIIWIILKFLLF